MTSCTLTYHHLSTHNTHRVHLPPKTKKEDFRLPFRTPSGCFGNALCASTGRFLYSGLVVVEQKCRIAKPVRKRNDFQVQI
jgi:hypothetical protein